MRRPKVTLDGLIAVVTVGETESLTRAGRLLSRAKSTVSKQISGVEKEVGAPLFYRLKNKMVPTEEGRIYIPNAVQSIRYARLGKDLVQASLRKKALRFLLGYTTYINPELLKRIERLSLDGAEAPIIERHSLMTSLVIQQVLNGALHAGVGFLPIRHPDLRVHEIFDEPLLVCLPARHRLAKNPNIRPEDLHEEAIIAIGREARPELYAETAAYFEEYGIHVKLAADAFAPREALLLVAQGKGFCLLTAHAAASPGVGVIVKPLVDSLLRRRTGVFVRMDSDGPFVSRFISEMLKVGDTLRRIRR